MPNPQLEACLVPPGDSRLLAVESQRACRKRGFNIDVTLTTTLLAYQVHRRQQRSVDGQFYVVHPLQVAVLVCWWGGSQQDLLAALPHDAAEDSPMVRVPR